MKIKVLYNDSQSLKECLEGKKRIMTYGAGVWADTIKKMLKENGYSLDYAIVDDAYYANCGNVIQQGGGYWAYFNGKACSALQFQRGCPHLGNRVTGQAAYLYGG